MSELCGNLMVWGIVISTKGGISITKKRFFISWQNGPKKTDNEKLNK